MRKLFHMALTKPSGEIVYTFISDIEVQNGLEQTADPESAAQTYSDLQKETESFFSSISERAASGRWRKHFSPYLCYRVTAPGLPMVATNATSATLPTRATLGQARSRHAWFSSFRMG
jgi:hypothetical protein